MLTVYLAMIDNDRDKEKFSAVYSFYHQKMFYIARQILTDEQLSEDAVQNAFLKIVTNFDKIEDDYKSEKTKALIITITKNASIDICRKRSHEVNMCEFEKDASYTIESECLNKLKIEIILEEVLALPPKYQQMLMMKYFHHMSTVEIADMLDISYDSARKRTRRAKDTLVEKLVNREII